MIYRSFYSEYWSQSSKERSGYGFYWSLHREI